MLTTKLTYEQMAERLATAYTVMVGGERIREMLFAFHNPDRGQRRSLRRLSEEHSVPRSTIHEWIVAAHVKLRQAGAMPLSWERHPLSNRTAANSCQTTEDSQR